MIILTTPHAAISLKPLTTVGYRFIGFSSLLSCIDCADERDGPIRGADTTGRRAVDSMDCRLLDIWPRLVDSWYGCGIDVAGGEEACDGGGDGSASETEG